MKRASVLFLTAGAVLLLVFVGVGSWDSLRESPNDLARFDEHRPPRATAPEPVDEPSAVNMPEDGQPDRRLSGSDSADPGRSSPRGRVDLLAYDPESPWAYRDDLVFQRLGRELIGRYQEAAAVTGSADLAARVRVGVHPSSPGDRDALMEKLTGLGFEGAAYRHTLGGELPLAALPEVAEISELRYLRAQAPVIFRGVAFNESVAALQIEALHELGYRGAGTRIGVISDSFNQLGGWDDDVLNGDLPGPGNPDGFTTPVTVVKDDLVVDPSPDEIDTLPTDEGRAMTQLVFDMAPEAELYFHSAFNNGGAIDATIAAAIEALVDAGCDIIVDDVGIATTSAFQDSFAAQAVTRATTDDSNLIYCSSAGNSGEAGIHVSPEIAEDTVIYEGAEVLVEAIDWDPGPGVDTRLTIEAFDETSTSYTLWWDDPYKSISPGSTGALTDLDIAFVDLETGEVLDSEGSNNLVTGDPFEFSDVDLEPGEYGVVVVLSEGPPPGEVRLVFHQPEVQLVDEYGDRFPTIYGHPAAAGGLAVGAADFRDTPAYGENPALAEDFSSSGPVFIYFDDQGARLPLPDNREVPDIVATDGNATSVEGFRPFYGTSAASPNLGAVFGVLRSAMPNLDRAALTQAVIDTAADMNKPGFDEKTGNGLAQPYQAAAALGVSGAAGPYLQNTDDEPRVGSTEAETRVGRPNAVAPNGFSLDGLSIEVVISDGGRTSDALSVAAGEVFGFEIDRVGDQLLIDGEAHAVVSGGTGPEDPLIVTIDSDDLTLRQLNAILSSIEFTSTGEDPPSGDRELEIELRDDGGSLAGSAIEVAVLPQTLRSWRREFFSDQDLNNPALESSLWGLEADPDEDGQINLVEYGLVSDPTDPASIGAIESGLPPIGFGEEPLTTAEFPAPAGRADIFINAQWSADLTSWSDDPFEIDVETVEMDDEPGVVMVRAVVWEKPSRPGETQAVRFLFSMDDES